MLFRFTTPARLCTAAATRPAAGLITLCQGGEGTQIIQLFSLKLDVIKNIFSSFRKHQAMHCAEEGQLDCKICKLVLNTRVSRVQRHNAMFLVNPVQHFLLYKLMLIQNYWQDELINHLKIHAGSRTVKGSVDKKFSCNQCDKKFFTRKDLKRHR